MESNAQRRGGGSLVPISPSQTPRSSEKSIRDLRSEGGNVSYKQHDNKDKGVNVQVIVRCRYISILYLLIVLLCLFEYLLIGMIM